MGRASQHPFDEANRTRPHPGSHSSAGAIRFSYRLQPPVISRIERSAVATNVFVQSWQGLLYTLEYKDGLGDAGWSPLPPAVPGTGGPITLSDSGSSPAGSRFYRVRCER